MIKYAIVPSECLTLLAVSSQSILSVSFIQWDNIEDGSINRTTVLIGPSKAVVPPILLVQPIRNKYSFKVGCAEKRVVDRVREQSNTFR